MNSKAEKRFMNNFQKISKEEYRNFLNNASFTTFFHQLEWQDFLQKQFKWLRFEYYSYKDEAILPIARFKVFGKEKLISLPFCEYGGPLPIKGDINWDNFSKDAFNEFGNNIKIKIHPRVSDVSGNPPSASTFLSSHWRSDLGSVSEQELWDSLRKTLRQEINNAQKCGLEIKKCKNQQELEKFYDLYVANLRRKKTIPYPRSLIQFLYKNASSELLLAFYKGRIIGGALFLQYSGFIHYFLSATDYRYRNLSVAHLILWEKIRGLINKDVIFDLGASPRGSALEIFKRGWGGKEYPIYQLGIKRSEENLRSSKLRNVFGLLPNFAIKALSPLLIKYRI